MIFVSGPGDPEVSRTRTVKIVSPTGNEVTRSALKQYWTRVCVPRKANTPLVLREHASVLALVK